MIITGTQRSLVSYLNGPTTALYGIQTYQLVAVWDEVDFVGEFKGLGLANGFDYSEQMSTVTELTFEWQGLGEKVGTSAVDMLTGSNGSNVFAAFGGDDVLNGSGGDSYQFMGNFSNDKVLEYGGYGVDILQIGASVEKCVVRANGPPRR